MSDRDRRDQIRDAPDADGPDHGNAVDPRVRAVIDRAPPLSAADVDLLRGFLPRPERRAGVADDAA